jgi:hypothetical protein
VPQPAVPGIIATRTIGDETFDLFVSHQVVFPLTPGPLPIPAARLEYAVPLSRRGSGDERVEQATSEPVRVEVTQLPETGRPDGFRGPTGQDLRLSYRIRALPAHAGEPLAVDVILAGVGNLTFWAPPNATWPAGTRAYLDRTEEAPRVVAGLLSGTKTFHFLLVPDSIGSIALPAMSYPYFDLGAGRYRQAEASGLVVPVLPGKNRLAGRDPPPLVPPGVDRPWLEPLEPGRSGWLIGIGFPVLALIAIRLARTRRAAVRPRPPRLDGVAELERLVSRIVPQANRGHAELLEQSLRRAGVTREQAAETARVKVELDRLRFTPGDSTGISGLGRRAGELIRALPRKVLRRGGLSLLVLTTADARGQTESAETMYREGALGPAAAAFEERARTDPRDWRHWYHAAAARYLAGEDAAAAARLVIALRVAPRAAPARALWGTLERQYEPLHQVRPGVGLSRPELGIASLGVVWVSAAIALVGWRRPRVRWSALLVAGVAVGAALWLPRPLPDLAFTTTAVRLHRSPHGLAPEEGGMPALSRVVVIQQRGDWRLVSDGAGARGWVLATGLASVDRVD